jgi:hypothetical protein
MPGNQEWSNALFRYYFNSENAGKEVLLYCDHDVIVEVAKNEANSGNEKFKHFLHLDSDAIKAKVLNDFRQALVIGPRYFNPKEWVQTLSDMKCMPGTPAPPYFAHLLLTIIAFSESLTQDNNINAQNYYDRLTKYFKLHWTGFNGEFDTHTFKPIYSVWRNMKIRLNSGEQGIWTLYQGRDIFVGIPRSQVIFKPVHLTRDLPEFFKKNVGIIEPKDWNDAIESHAFKNKFPNAHRFKNRDFVIKFLKGRWETWRNEETKERKSKTATSGERNGVSGALGSYPENLHKNEANPLAPISLTKVPRKRRVVGLHWCADAQGKLFFTLWIGHECKINERTYRFGDRIPFEEIWNKEYKEIRFNYEGRNGLKNVVALTECDEGWREYTGDPHSFLKGNDVMLICPLEKKDDIVRLIPSVLRIREYDGFNVYRSKDFPGGEILFSLIGIKPKFVGISGLTSGNNTNKRTFLNIDALYVTLKYVPKNAEIVAVSEINKCKLVHFKKGDNSEERIWLFEALTPAGQYTLYYNGRPLNPKHPINIIEAEISESVGANIPWRNLYGEACMEADGPAYKGFRLSMMALKELGVATENPLIADISIDLTDPSHTVPELEIPITPADKLLYYISERNEFSWNEFKQAKVYIEDEAQPVYPSRFEPQGYIDCDWESKDRENRVKVLPPALVIQHDYDCRTNIKFALVGARTPNLLKKINETIGAYNGTIEFKPAKGLPTAVYCVFKNMYNAQAFAKKLNIQIETGVWLKTLTHGEIRVLCFSKILELLKIDMDPYIYSKRNVKHKTEDIPVKSGTQGLECWEKYDSNSQKFVALTELKSAELAKTMLVRRLGVHKDGKGTSTQNLPFYYKEKKRGKVQCVRAFPLPQRWGEILYYAYLARNGKSKNDWWKKVFQLTNKDGRLRVRKTIGLPPPLDRITAMMDATGSEFQNAKGLPSNNKKAFRTYNVSPNLLILLSKAFGIEFPKKK